MTVPNMRETESTGIKKHACLPLTFSIIMTNTPDTKGRDKSNTCMMKCVAYSEVFLDFNTSSAFPTLHVSLAS